MKAIVMSLGIRGDVEPFLAIAQLLRENDWQVICAFLEQFQDLVKEAGFPFFGLSKSLLSS